MEFIVNQKGNAAVVEINAEKLNARNAADLKAELVVINKGNTNNIVIDMAKVKYCDSSGLSSILIANRLCKDTNGKFVLCGLQSNVQKLIEIAQLDKVLNITETVDQALESI